MLRLLSSDYNNCWNMVFVSNIGNQCSACCHQTITTVEAWSFSMILVISSLPVVMNVKQQLDFDLCTFYGQ